MGQHPESTHKNQHYASFPGFLAKKQEFQSLQRREREGQNGFGKLAESGASQDADVAGSSFGGFVVSANCPAGFGSAIAPIREPFLNWFR